MDRSCCNPNSLWHHVKMANNYPEKKNIIQTENFIYLRVTSEKIERMLNQSDARATKNGRRGMMETLPWWASRGSQCGSDFYGKKPKKLACLRFTFFFPFTVNNIYRQASLTAELPNLIMKNVFVIYWFAPVPVRLYLNFLSRSANNGCIYAFMWQRRLQKESARLDVTPDKRIP